MGNLYEKYIKLLIDANDENRTESEHCRLVCRLNGWLDGVRDSTGQTFNGDYYYIALFDSGEMEERPICCGQFIDWKSKTSAVGHEI